MEGDTEEAFDQLVGTAFKDMVRTTGSLFGGGIWYVRGALERFIFDQWEQAINPTGFRDRVKQQEKYMDQIGQEFFFAPGELAPDRAPQFGEPQERF